jgi:hypothetical protein
VTREKETLASLTLRLGANEALRRSTLAELERERAAQMKANLHALLVAFACGGAQVYAPFHDELYPCFTYWPHEPP